MPPKPDANKVLCEVDKDTLEQLASSLSKLKVVTGDASDSEAKERGRPRTKGNTNKAQNSDEKVDQNDLNGILNHILKAITVLGNSVAELKANRQALGELDVGVVSKLEQRIQVQEDEQDEARQRSLKGNLILTSPAINSKVSLIKSDTQLKQENESLTDHIVHLVKTKYDVTLPEADIQALHHLPNGSVVMRVWNRRPGSAWYKLLDAIKSGKNQEYNFYANFHLTRRRNGLLYEIRQLKKAGRIHKFFTDENVAISFKVAATGTKHKVTYFVPDPKNNKFGQPKTLVTKDDIVAIIENQK